MPTVQYTGPSHFRTISKSDFTAAGVDDAERLEVCREDVVNDGDRNPGRKIKNTAEVTQAVADFLIENEGKVDWKIVDDAQPVPSQVAAGELQEPIEGEQDHPAAGTEGAGTDAVPGLDAGGASGATRTTGRVKK